MFGPQSFRPKHHTILQLGLTYGKKGVPCTHSIWIGKRSKTQKKSSWQVARFVCGLVPLRGPFPAPVKIKNFYLNIIKKIKDSFKFENLHKINVINSKSIFSLYVKVKNFSLTSLKKDIKFKINSIFIYFL